VIYDLLVARNTLKHFGLLPVLISLYWKGPNRPHVQQSSKLFYSPWRFLHPGLMKMSGPILICVWSLSKYMKHGKHGPLFIVLSGRPSWGPPNSRCPFHASSSASVSARALRSPNMYTIPGYRPRGPAAESWETWPGRRRTLFRSPLMADISAAIGRFWIIAARPHRLAARQARPLCKSSMPNGLHRVEGLNLCPTLNLNWAIARAPRLASAFL